MKTAIENDVDVAIEEAAQFLETNVKAQDMKQKK
jgi:dTDP-D-glucose 4,6-dehydratase